MGYVKKLQFFSSVYCQIIWYDQYDMQVCDACDSLLLLLQSVCSLMKILPPLYIKCIKPYYQDKKNINSRNQLVHGAELGIHQREEVRLDLFTTKTCLSFYLLPVLKFEVDMLPDVLSAPLKLPSPVEQVISLLLFHIFYFGSPCVPVLKPCVRFCIQSIFKKTWIWCCLLKILMPFAIHK